MREADQPFERLCSAWFRGSLGAIGESGSPEAAKPRTQRAAEECIDHHPSAMSVHSDPRLNSVNRVVVTRGAQMPPPLFECGLLASQQDAQRVYQIEPIVIASLDEIEHRFLAHPPRVLIVDIGLIKATDAAALRHARRRLPATDWLGASDAPVAGDVDISVLGELRGCIQWATSAEHLACGLDAVLAGKLWFPRGVLESLCLSVLASHEPGQSGMLIDDRTKELTAREAEVFKLMRHGLTNRQIAERMGVSANTIKKHLANVFEKRGLHSRRQERE